MKKKKKKTSTFTETLLMALEMFSLTFLKQNLIVGFGYQLIVKKVFDSLFFFNRLHGRKAEEEDSGARKNGGCGVWT